MTVTQAVERVLLRLAHRHTMIVFTAAGAGVITHYFPWWPLYLAEFTLIMTTLACIVGSIHHARILCETCVATFPLNAAELAHGQLRSTLRASHLATGHPVLCFAIFITLGVSQLWIWWSGPLTWIFLGASIWADRWHRTLAPYCPWCHGGDDSGDGDNLPIGPPTPPGRKVAT